MITRTKKAAATILLGKIELKEEEMRRVNGGENCCGIFDTTCCPDSNCGRGRKC
jgi:hypothetical protein